jgi:hypothetical protein
MVGGVSAKPSVRNASNTIVQECLITGNHERFYLMLLTKPPLESLSDAISGGLPEVGFFISGIGAVQFPILVSISLTASTMGFPSQGVENG